MELVLVSHEQEFSARPSKQLHVAGGRIAKTTLTNRLLVSGIPSNHKHEGSSPLALIDFLASAGI
jgi:hypothetical protein